MERRLAAILAADVVGYSRLIREDEAGTLAAVKAHREQLIAPKVAEHKGRIVKLMGDGLLVEFPSAVEAVQCAVEIQHMIGDRNAEIPEENRVTYRIGINIGDIVVEDDDIYGDGVNVAARLEGLAEPGGICLSRTVVNHVKGKVELDFEDMGEQQVKNISEPIRVYRVVSDALAVQTVRSPSTVLPLPDKPSIAVLPFENMSGDPEQEYFADGMTEDIITALSKNWKLFVIARHSTFAYKGRAVDVKQVGREQGVRYVLEGSVQRRGNRLRITAQLVDAGTGYHLWVDRYDRQVENIFALQDEITREVASALQAELTDGEQARLWASGTDNLEAWELATQAYDLIHRHHREDTHEARKLVQEALRYDESYATAWGMLGYTHWTDARNKGWSESREQSLDLAEAAAERALAIDSFNPDTLALCSLIQLSKGKHDAALPLVEKATAVAPNHAHATALVALVALACGKPQLAADLISKAIRLCPIYPTWYTTVTARAYWAMNRTEEAVATARRAIAHDPDLSYAYLVLAKVFAEADRNEEAQAAAAEIQRVDPGFSVSAWAGGLPYHDPELRARQVNALLKAGLPE